MKNILMQGAEEMYEQGLGHYEARDLEKAMEYIKSFEGYDIAYGLRKLSSILKRVRAGYEMRVEAEYGVRGKWEDIIRRLEEAGVGGENQSGALMRWYRDVSEVIGLLGDVWKETEAKKEAICATTIILSGWRRLR